MKIIFFGTPDYVLPILEKIHREFDLGKERQIIAVVTQPPQKSGRDQRLEYSAVDTWAHKRKIPIIFKLDEIPEFDLGIMAAYGRIIPQHIISKAKLGILNVHPSLLPKYRGASPVQAAITAGDSLTGVSVIKTDNKMDHGPIVSQFKEEILPTDTTETLRTRLFEISAQFLLDLIPNYIKGKIKLKPQDHDKATFTKILKREDGHIEDPFKDPIATDRFIRAMTPWPEVWTYVDLKSDSHLSGHARLPAPERSDGGQEVTKKVRSRLNQDKQRLKLLKAHLDNEKLILDEVQLEGKNVVSWEQFTRGYPKFQFGDSKS